MASDQDLNHHLLSLLFAFAPYRNLIFLYTIELGFLVDVHYTFLLVPNWSVDRLNESIEPGDWREREPRAQPDP